MKVLVSGAGVAGPALAWWLVRYGAEVTIVERAQELRTGGYVVDFWGAGFEIADRMGLIPEIRRKGYMVREVRVVGRDGRRVSGFPVEAFARIAQNRYTSVPRGDLSQIIFRDVEPKIETLFGDTIEKLEQDANGVTVQLARGGERRFDIIIGADGLHSNVRRLIFGPDDRFEVYLGFKVAAFSVQGYRPREELVYLMYTEVGQQVNRFSMRDDRTMFLFTFADRDPAFPQNIDEQKALLRRRFGGSGWESGAILDALDQAPELYFDRVSQIRMPAEEWCAGGRVALVGDAASCVSLLAGEGSGLAIVAAYILAGELHRAGGDYQRAFVRYRDLFRPFVAEKQRAALRFARSFAPPSKLSIVMRNAFFRLMAIGWIADLLAGRGLRDDIVLPEY
ncbi:MAG TPA: FAD-binding domain [Thermoanaerobaculia bacterium]|jgi:2-polyprenyl-6-methoxyphenol hydroxylase-like FAD-dependent oxidoreductase|nr:FAD-binding domain [Thermoanaerobaculia bacterium]